MSGQFDTSGSVSFHVHEVMQTKIWTDLDPFTQGYGEAVCRAAEDTLGGFTATGVRFSDLALSGDNAVVVAAAANGLPKERRDQAMIWGIGLAIGLRILLTGIAGWLLAFKGVAILGGLALLWIAYKIATGYFKAQGDEAAKTASKPQDLSLAILAIIVADVSMSLDNVAAIAALTRGRAWVMIFGLLLSVAIMGLGAKAVSVVLEKYKWLQLAAAALVGFLGVQMFFSAFFSR